MVSYGIMKIATHNTEFLFDIGEHTYGGKTWTHTPEFVAARVRLFGNLFREIDADILLLQEVGQESVVHKIISESAIPYSAFFGAPDISNVRNAILWRGTEGQAESIPAFASLPVFNEGDADILGSRMYSRRDFVHLRTMHNGKKLHVFSIHLKSNFLNPEILKDGTKRPMKTQTELADGIIRSDFFRLSQAKKLRQILDQIFTEDPDAEVIVGGDFNDVEINSTVGIVMGKNQEAPDALIQTTKAIPKEKRFSGTGRGEVSLIDHILASKNLMSSLTSARILNENLSFHENVAPTPTFPESDHAPIVVEFN